MSSSVRCRMSSQSAPHLVGLMLVRTALAPAMVTAITCSGQRRWLCDRPRKVASLDAVGWPGSCGRFRYCWPGSLGDGTGPGDAAKPDAVRRRLPGRRRIVPRIAGLQLPVSAAADGPLRVPRRSATRPPVAGPGAAGAEFRAEPGKIKIVQPERVMARAPGLALCSRRETRLPAITALRWHPQDQALPARHPGSDRRSHAADRAPGRTVVNAMIIPENHQKLAVHALS